MIFTLTQAGKDEIAANPGVPMVLNQFKIGSQFNYAPTPTQGDIEGTLLYSGQPSYPIVHPDNIIQYTILLPSSVGDFFFGEVGMYLNGELMVIGVSQTAIRKVASYGDQEGNYLNLSAYVTTLGSVPNVFSEVGNSMENVSLETAYSIDTLPPASIAEPNVRVVPHYGYPDSGLAVSNGGRWSVTGYEVIPGNTVATDTSAVHVSVSTDIDEQAFSGDVLVQCLNGPAAGLIRQANYDQDLHRFVLVNPWSVLPLPGTTIEVMQRAALPQLTLDLLRSIDPNLTADDLNSLLAHPLNQMVKRDGAVAMTGPLNMGGFRVTNAGSPMVSSDVVNLDFLNAALSSIVPPEDIDGGFF